MPATHHVLTAEEVIAKTAAHQREQQEFATKRAELEAYMDLRDDVCSIVQNSHLSLEQIHAKGGPTVKTLEKWMNKEVLQPRISKMRSVLRICGYDFAIVDKARNLVVAKRGLL